MLSYHSKIKICDCGVSLQCLGNSSTSFIHNYASIIENVNEHNNNGNIVISLQD